MFRKEATPPAAANPPSPYPHNVRQNPPPRGRLERITAFQYAIFLALSILCYLLYLSNAKVFADSRTIANGMIGVALLISGALMFASGKATQKIRNMCAAAACFVGLVMVANVICHFLLARNIETAKNGVIARAAEATVDHQREGENNQRRIALTTAQTDGQKAYSEELRVWNIAARTARRAQQPIPPMPRQPDLINLAPSSQRSAEADAINKNLTNLTVTGGPVEAPAQAAAMGVAGWDHQEKQWSEMTPGEVLDWWMPILMFLAALDLLSSMGSALLIGWKWEQDANDNNIPDQFETVPGKA